MQRTTVELAEAKVNQLDVSERVSQAFLWLDVLVDNKVVVVVVVVVESRDDSVLQRGDAAGG